MASPPPKPAGPGGHANLVSAAPVSAPAPGPSRDSGQAPVPPDPVDEEAMRSRIATVMDRAQAGDRSVLPELRELLASGAVDLTSANLAQTAANTLIAGFGKNNVGVEELLRQKMADLRAELEGKTPSAVERLLAERVVCCWLQLYHIECLRAAALASDQEPSAFSAKDHDKAHKRYLSSLKALAEIRKLNVTLQLNIAKTQTIVGGV